MRIDSAINYINSPIISPITESNLFTSLSQQKKIALIFAAIFSAVVIAYAIYRSLSQYVKLEEDPLEADFNRIALNRAQILKQSMEVPVENQDKVQKAIANFANDLCNRISASQPAGKSFSISPVSIIAALGMCLHAIQQDKKEQFIRQLGLEGLNETEVHAALAASLKKTMLPQDFEDGTIEIAQGLARKRETVIDASLLALIQGVYDGDVIVSDDIMYLANRWVARQTHGKITSILSDNSADLVLLNAVYLNLQWEKKFDTPSRGWAVRNFTFADGTQEPVSIMRQEGKFNILKEDNFSMLEKPYLSPNGRKLSQVIFLPNDPKDLENLEKTLDDAAIKNYRRAAMLYYDVDLIMPKTKGECKLELLDLLEEMGLPLDSVDPKIINAVISSVIHKTFVSTNEEGTEAAAVTAIEYECMAMMPVEPEYFHITHSYAYLIMDGDTVLFRGRVSDADPLVLDAKKS